MKNIKHFSLKSLAVAVALAFSMAAHATEYTNNTAYETSSTTANTSSGSFGWAGVNNVAGGGSSMGQGSSASTSPGFAAVNQNQSGYMSQGATLSAGAVWFGMAGGSSSGTNSMHQQESSLAAVVDTHVAAGWVDVSQNATQAEAQAGGVSAWGNASSSLYATQLQQAAQSSQGGAAAINWPAAGAGISASQGAVQQQVIGTSVYSSGNGSASAGGQQVQETHLDQTTNSGAVAF